MSRELKYHIYIIRDYVWKDGSIGKIGATEDIQRRAKSYKLESLEILESHTNLKEVSKREMELQAQYGFKIDHIEYWKARKMHKSPESKKKRVDNIDWKAYSAKMDYPAIMAKIDHKARTAKIDYKAIFKNRDMKTALSNVDWQARNNKIDWEQTVKTRKASEHLWKDKWLNKVRDIQCKPVNQYDLEDNFIKRWDSAIDAAKELNVSNSNICACCRGKQKTAYKSIWKYAG